MTETPVVRTARRAFRWWPFRRGRGWILRLARLLLGNQPVAFDIGGGMFIAGPLNEFMMVWAFTREHERDRPFQRSLQFLQPGSTAIDAGANFGIWTLLASKRGASVHAFEPVPTMADRLRQHVAVNDRSTITVNELALADECGSRSFFVVAEKNTGASSFSPRRPDSSEIRVAVTTVDDYVARAALTRVDLLNVDIEGAEILLFRGARRLLSREDAPVVFFELDEHLCAAFGVTTAEVKRLLAECGYGIYRWREEAFREVDLDESHRHEDLFALKPRHAAGVIRTTKTA